MFRRSCFRMVELFNALLPNVGTQVLLTPDQLATAKAAVEEAHDILKVETPIIQGMERLLEPRSAWKSQKIFSECVDACRAALLLEEKESLQNPLRRLELHELLMAAGYYERVIDYTRKKDARQFVLNHYNFDVRRDIVVVRAIHTCVLEAKETTPLSEQALAEALIMERRLFGPNRLVPVGGKKFVVLGVEANELHSEEEANRFLELDPVKRHGNFIVSTDDPEGSRWKTMTIRAAPEEVEPFYQLPAKEADMMHTLTILKPAAALTFGERATEFLLRLWVYVFTFWAIFFMFDEEVITLVVLLWSKYQTMSQLKAESKRLGGKRIYIGNGRRFPSTIAHHKDWTPKPVPLD